MSYLWTASFSCLWSSLVTHNGWGSKYIILLFTLLWRAQLLFELRPCLQRVKRNNWVELLKFIQVLCFQYVLQSLYSTIRNLLDVFQLMLVPHQGDFYSCSSACISNIHLPAPTPLPNARALSIVPAQPGACACSMSRGCIWNSQVVCFNISSCNGSFSAVLLALSGSGGSSLNGTKAGSHRPVLGRGPLLSGFHATKHYFSGLLNIWMMKTKPFLACCASKIILHVSDPWHKILENVFLSAFLILGVNNCINILVHINCFGYRSVDRMDFGGELAGSVDSEYTDISFGAFA